MIARGLDSSGNPKPIDFVAASDSEVAAARKLREVLDRDGSEAPHFTLTAASERYFRNPYETADVSRLHFGSSEMRLEQLCDLVANRLMDDEEKVGPYVGVSGIALALFRASQIFHGNVEFSKRLLAKSHELQAATQKYRASSKAALLYLLGECGFLTVNLLTGFDSAHAENQLQELEKIGRTFSEDHSQMWDELFCGRCGFLAAALVLRQEKRISIDTHLIQGVLHAIIRSGQAHARRSRSRSPLMFEYHGKEYFGAAHGLCGIVQMLLNFHDLLDSDQLQLLRGTINWLATTQSADGNFPSSGGHIGESHHSLVHWCHGAPGFALLFLSAHRVFGDQSYMAVMERALDCLWHRGMLRKGPGLCHGLSGNGYIFLLAYRFSGREEFFHKARAFAVVMFSEQFQRLANTPDCPFSLFEGWAGAISFLADLLEPHKAQFPLYPIRDYSYLPESL
uniref:Lanthionine synthetase C-like protein n=1 Tax=Steinernema glaseri TaxID=37863 RepID=A0A1I7YGY5_9BILA